MFHLRNCYKKVKPRSLSTFGLYCVIHFFERAEALYYFKIPTNNQNTN
jgi:hypothetical protein